jgi:hypothetical protein
VLISNIETSRRARIQNAHNLLVIIFSVIGEHYLANLNSSPKVRTLNSDASLCYINTYNK